MATLQVFDPLVVGARRNGYGAAEPGRLAWTVRMTEPVSEHVSPEAIEALKQVDDRGLVRAFVDGQTAAFETLVERHRRSVYQLCYRFAGNHEDASDLSQEVFIRAFRGLKKFKGDSSVSTWLYRIGVNACLNKVAVKRPPMDPIDGIQLEDAKVESPDARLARDEKAVVVRRAIAQLPPKQRATLVLRLYQELSHEEIAHILGSSVGAVKANFFHALGNVKRLLEAK